MVYEIIRRSVRAAIISTIITISSAQAQEQQPTTPIELQTKSWNYIPNGESTNYNITIISPNASEITTIEDAVEMIKRDNIPALLLAGEFPEQQIRVIKSAVQKMCAKNPNIISILEPIVVKLREGQTSCAMSNWYELTIQNIDSILRKYYGNREFEEIASNESYDQKVDKTKKSIVQIPTSDEEYTQIIDSIITSQRNDEVEGFDIVLHGIQGETAERNFIHEIGHLIIDENPEGHDTLIRLRSTESNIVRSDSWTSQYVYRRETEVLAWVERKKADLESIITICESLSDEEKEIIKTTETQDSETIEKARVINALENIGKEKLIRYYNNILNEAVLDWRIGESIAEDVVDIVNNDERYMGLRVVYNGGKMLLEINMQDLERATIENASPEKIAEINKEIETIKEIILRMEELSIREYIAVEQFIESIGRQPMIEEK